MTWTYWLKHWWPRFLPDRLRYSIILTNDVSRNFYSIIWCYKNKVPPLLSFQTIFSLKSASSLSSQREPVIANLPWPQRRLWNHRTQTLIISKNEVFCDQFPMRHFHLSKLGKCMTEFRFRKISSNWSVLPCLPFECFNFTNFHLKLYCEK